MLMSVIKKVKSGAKMEDIVGYSRVVAVDNHVFVSNTAGRDPETGEMPDSFKAQAQNTINMIERSLKAVGSCLEDIVAYRAYAPNSDDLKEAAEILGATFRGIDPCCTMTCSPLAAPHYKFEMEATAIIWASKRTVEIIKI